MGGLPFGLLVEINIVFVALVTGSKRGLMVPQKYPPLFFGGPFLTSVRRGQNKGYTTLAYPWLFSSKFPVILQKISFHSL